MKKLLLAIVACAGFGVAAMAQSSGTDAYGYSWKSSGQTGGPTYNWIDISTSGTPITGLGDDNFVGPIPIGFDFTYYWLNYNQIYVGSNGFLSFGQGYNLASGQIGATGNGFNNLPYAGDAPKNNMIAPFLADLSFVYGNGNAVPAAKAYYQNMGDKFVVSYEHVPYYNDAGTNDVMGDNSFQVILDNTDSSITIQYRATTTGYDANYTAWLVRGFENINGNMGATISNGGSASNNSLPTAQSAVKIDYPAVPLVQTTDVRVAGVFNAANGAEFIYQGSSTSIRGIVQNSGATDISTPFQVRAVVQDAQGNEIMRDTVMVNTLNRNQSTTVSFPRSLPVSAGAGSYTVAITSFLTGDGNAANDLAETELVVVDSASSSNPIYMLGYDTQNYPQGGTQSYESQNGGIYIKPPAYPARMIGVQFDMGWVRDDDYRDSTTEVTFRVFKDDGPNGTPGTWLGEWTVGYDYRTIGDSVGELNLQTPNVGKIMRSNLYLPAAYSIADGGVYIGMFMDRTTGFFWNAVARDLTPPFSSRAYEIPGNVWAEHRNNGTFDYALRGLFSQTFVANKAKSALAGLRVAPNPASGAIRIEGHTGKAISVMNANGQVVMSIATAAGMPAIISLENLSKGLYTLRTDSGQVSRFVKE